jgi:quercetin dioxygenase-like cupin family protein
MRSFFNLTHLDARPADNIGMLSILQGAQLTMAYTRLHPGAVIPLHQHPEEAVDIVLEGELEMQIGDERETLVPGMVTIVPPGIPHTAMAVTYCRVVTVFPGTRS